MKKELVWRIIFLLFCLVCIGSISFCYYNFVVQNDVVYSSGEQYLDREEYTFSPLFQDENDILVQKFVPQYDFLVGMDIRLAVNYAGLTDTFVVRITLMDEKEVLVQKDVDLTNFSNWRYYTLEVNKAVNPRKEYSIQIQQIVGPKEQGKDTYWISYVAFESPVHIKENNRTYLYNGQEFEGELEICYTYHGQNGILVWRCILVSVCLLFLGVCSYVLINWLHKKKERIYKCIGIVVWLIIPFVTYFLAEAITGNIWDVTMGNMVKNILLYCVFYFFLSIVIGHYKIVAALMLILGIVLALAQYFVSMFRGRPLMVQDVLAVKTVMTVVSSYNFSMGLRVYGAVFAAIMTLCVIYICPKHNFLRSWKVRMACGGGLIGLSIGCILYPNFLGSINMWDIATTYQTDGLLLTMIEEIPYLIIEKPEGYSEEKVAEIIQDIAWESADAEVIPHNIIVIMNESFSDLECINDIKTNTELLPYWKSIEENAITGYLYVPVFGAGTANSEYEVLTGNTTEFLSVGSSAYQMNVGNEEAGMAEILRKQGYDAVAMHPYYAANWNRTSVYVDMGFEEFISEENWGEMDYIRWCASDSTVYSKIIEECEESDEQKFVFAVTMQNHGGYAEEWDNFVNEVELLYETEYPQAEQYLSLMQESDRAFQVFLDYFTESDENTMIVMFGDHQATLEEKFYSELFGKDLSQLNFAEVQERYKTPFVIWTNYDIAEKANVCMSSNYFGSYILNMAGVELTKYNEFLLCLMKQVPVIGIGGVRTKEDVWYTWNSLPEPYDSLLKEYEILQYNNVFDRENRKDSVFLFGGN